ncbi:MAG: type A chloramphenicol O-acetyltransferase [Faecalibacterium sp.]
MPAFHKIDLENWNRKASYEHYSAAVPCTYSMTVNLDITSFLQQVKQNKLPFFASVLYGISHAVNQHSEFRMDVDADGNLGYYDGCNPCYTVFHPECETFTNVWTQYDADFAQFLQNYKADMAQYQADATQSKPLPDSNVFNVSCIPWTSFTGFNLNLQKGYDYYLPIFTIGKYFTEGDKVLLPLAIQVHHAVCDGYHLARWIDELQRWMSSFSKG